MTNDDFVKVALSSARFERVKEPQSGWFGEVGSGLAPGVWAYAASLDLCLQELEEVLRGWIELEIDQPEKAILPETEVVK